MPTVKPKLELTTPVTATFPSELSALSARTPLSAVPVLVKEECIKTPITPPLAYMDFLKSISVASPVIPEKRPGSSSEDEDDEDAAAPDSMPSTASSEQTDCSCKCGNHGASKSPTAAGTPASPYPSYPLSAPPTGVASFPSLHIPPSPATSILDSPLSATPSSMRSPFSARSVRSSFDWEAALKARYSQDCKAIKPSSVTSAAAGGGGRSVRHYREVVTRTVTYTPRMSPAPRGKRRKTECPMAQKQSCATRAHVVAAAAELAVAAAAACGPPTPPAPTTRSKSA